MVKHTTMDVTLYIDFDNIKPSITTIQTIASGSTVLDLLAQCEERKIIDFTAEQSNEEVKVTSLNGVRNEGKGVGHKNWTFYVNGTNPSVGCDKQVVKKHVSFKFSTSDSLQSSQAK